MESNNTVTTKLSWKWLVGKSLPENFLFRFTAKSQIKSQKKMVLDAVGAFYLPLAIDRTDGITEADVQEIYMRSRAALLQQVQILDTKFQRRGSEHRLENSVTQSIPEPVSQSNPEYYRSIPEPVSQPSISNLSSLESQPPSESKPGVVTSKSGLTIDFSSLYD